MRNAAVFLEVADWLPDPLVLLRRSGEILAANRTAVRHLQLPETPLSGALLQSHVAGDYREVDVFIGRCARTRGPLPGRIPIRLADGTVLSCRCSGGLFHQQGDGGPHHDGGSDDPRVDFGRRNPYVTTRGRISDRAALA